MKVIFLSDAWDDDVLWQSSDKRNTKKDQLIN